jgi:UDPglucose--hexose-1-phosphate uridylyltransferase
VNELRWHALLNEWVCVAAHRQDRPQMPADWCPFCPGSGRVPDDYDVFLYANDFAAFQLDNPAFCPEPGLFRSTGARGATDVVLYHPHHTLAPSQMGAAHWRKVVDLWTSRYAELARIPDLRYVYMFENTGVAIGVTMPHPHGQIYSFPYIPPIVERQLESARKHYQKQHECLYCRLLGDELADGRRIVLENPGFVAFVPFAARYPAEMQIYARRHASALTDFTAEERSQLANLIKTVRMKYDNLFGFPMPLMMILRQRPTQGDYPYAHFHIEFFPIQRSPTKLKYLAGVESGAGTFLNDTVAEEKAEELRGTEPVG